MQYHLKLSVRLCVVLVTSDQDPGQRLDICLPQPRHTGCLQVRTRAANEPSLRLKFLNHGEGPPYYPS